MLAHARAFRHNRHTSRALRVAKGCQMKRDWSGWAIVTSGGSRYIGRIAPGGDPGGIIMSPVYEYVSAWQISPQHGIGKPKHILPVEMFPDAETLECAQYENIIHVPDLGEIAKRHLGEMLDAAEKIVQQIRAQASGIVIADANTRLAPINGGRA